MTDDSARIDDLEIRLMHQEASLEQLTASLLAQERLIAAQSARIEELGRQLRAITPAQVADRADETPPPHY